MFNGTELIYRNWRINRRLGVIAILAIVISPLIIGISRPGFAASKLTIAGVRGFSENEAGTVILKEAYKRIGIDITIKRYPAERAIKLANQGAVDGDIQRIEAVKKLYKNLIQVKPAINYFEASAFSARHDFPVKGWNSLRPYRIGIIRGMKFADVNTGGMKRIVVGSYESLLKMISLGRIDVGVLPRINGLYQIVKWDTPKVRELKPALIRIKLYHFVHRKNAHLVPLLSAVIKKMHDQGELSALRQKATSFLLKTAITATKGNNQN